MEPARAATDPLLRQVLDELAALRREVAALRAELRRASEADRALIEAARDAMADAVFESSALLAAGLRRDAVGLRLAGLLQGRSVRAVGKLLQQAADKATASGLVLRAVGGGGSSSRLWHVGRGLKGPQTHAGA